jgi:transcription antitermination factor NusG
VKTFIESGEDLLADIPEMKTGDRVYVTRSSLKGLEGTLIEFQQKHRVRIMIDGIQQSLHLNIPLSHLKPLKS